MKKTLLHISLGLVVLYAAAAACVLLCQGELKTALYGLPDSYSVPLFPVLEILFLLAEVALAVLFLCLLLRSASRPGLGLETGAVILFGLLLALSPPAVRCRQRSAEPLLFGGRRGYHRQLLCGPQPDSADSACF